jgi:branched-chain amino acid transport system substrate-binding protein
VPVVAVALGTALLLAACGSSSSGASSESPSASGTPTGEPIIIGHAAGQTGFMNAYDGPVGQFAELAIAEINAKGGVGGRPLKLIKTDTKSKPELGQTAADEAIEQGAQFIIPSCDYDMGGGAAREAQAKGVLAIGCAGKSNFGFTGIGPLVFNSYASNAAESAAMGQFAYDKGYKKPYYFIDDSLAVMPEQCAFAKETYEKLGGGTSAGEVTFKNGDASVATQVDKIKAAAPDVVFLCSYVPGGASAAKQLRAALPDVPVISGVGMEGTGWTASIPNLSNYYAVSLGVYPGSDPDAEREAAFQAFEAKYGDRPEVTLGLTGYTDIQLLAAAIEKAGGSTEGQAVADALQTFTDFPVITGTVTYTPECHIPFTGDFVVIGITDGKAALAAEVKPSYIPASPC